MQFGPLFHLIWPYALQLGGIAFAGWLGKHVKNNSDAARANAIALVAKDVAAQVYANNPSLSWLDLVKQVADQLAGETTPNFTSNRDVLERAAAGGLMAVGAGPKK